ncbi:MAG: Ig-like domain-containing protein [Gemmatimonadota bacterium]
MNRITFASAALVAALVSGCSKSSTGPSTTPTATTVQVISGSGQTGLIGTELPAPLVVKVLDQFDAPMAGIGTFFNGNIGGTASTPLPTDANGVTQVTFTLGTKAGLDTITVTAGGVTNTGKIAATVLPGPAATIKKLAGDGQLAPPGTVLSFPFVISVKDSYGNNIQGVVVTWTSDASGVLNPTSTPTDTTGQAQTTYTLSSSAGVQTVTAHIGGVVVDVRFLATAR